MNNAKKSLVPHRRFKEFQNAGAWEQRKLGDVVERFDNLRIPVTSSKRKRGITPYYGANGIQDYVQGYTHDGEFVLVAEDGANDLQNYPIHYVNGKVWVNNHAHVLQGKKDIADNLFLVNAIKRIKFETYLVGGSRAKLNADVMMKLPIKMPKLNEQQKLGKYFSRIDTLIALHQRKLNKLKKLKSAYLTEMFPDEGEHKPKRRFAGFTDDWEQHKFGELVIKLSKTSHATRKLPSVEYDDVIPETGSLNKDIFNKEMNKSGIYFSESDVLFGKLRPYLKNWLNPQFKGVAIGDWWVLKPNSLLQTDFLYWLIQTKNFMDIANQTTGTKMPRSDWNFVSNANLKIPGSIKEQNAISSILNNLNTLITLHQRKIDKLQKLKNAYLNEMFV